MTSHPTISVVMVTYNHEKFIGEAVESILNQTFEDFELIIVDDGSTDSTMDIIAQYDDPRIIAFTQENSGPSIAFNNGLNRSRGDYIAFMSGDDISLENRLELQLNQLKQKNSGIVFSLPNIINSKSELLENETCPSFFGKTFDSIAELYKILFYKGNFLCASSAFCNKSVITKLGFFKRGLIQLQDFDYWIRACKKGIDIQVYDLPLINYRYLGRNNLSDIFSHKNRILSELIYIYDNYFNNTPEKLFNDAFNHDPVFISLKHIEEIEVKEAFLLFNHKEPYVKIIGAKKIIDILDNIELYEKIIYNSYFSFADFFAREDDIKFINIEEIEFKRKNTSLKKNLKMFIKSLLGSIQS